MIDIHCHILPGIDDGAASLEVSLAMARLAVADGTRTIVATPHVDKTLIPPEEVRRRVADLQQALDRQQIPLTLLAGADGASYLGAEALSGHVIGDGPYLLLEFPHTHLPVSAGQLVFDLKARGLVPIITHPERNPSVVRHPDLLEPLIEAGALVQVTCGSLTGDFGGASRACARHLLRRGMVHFLASDGHSDTWRQPVMAKAVRLAAKLIGKDQAQDLVSTNPQKVVKGENMEARG